jgi:diaminopropionate ammonia-lyase
VPVTANSDAGGSSTANSATLFFWNQSRSDAPSKAQPSSDALKFHRRLPGYRPTRLIPLDDAASELQLDRVWLKDESHRLGVPSFKILGVSWATYRLLSERVGGEAPEWTTLADLQGIFRKLQPLTLIAATDGNHGRAVARVARWFGCNARILVPRTVPPGRAAAIRSERAEVVVIDGSYDDAVEAAVSQADDRSLLVQDTALSAGETNPARIVEGYSTLFWEIDHHLRELNEPMPDLVVIQIGVGSLAGAAAAHFRRQGPSARPKLIGVEPLSAACVFESARAGELRTVDGPHTSIMDCLNAGIPSIGSLDALLAGFDGFAAIDDQRVAECMRALAQRGVVAGTTGVAGLAGLYEIRRFVSEARSALLVNTEGAADPDGYASRLLNHR